MGVLGLEPRSLAAQDFESSVFTNFTILPVLAQVHKLAMLYHFAISKSNEQLSIVSEINRNTHILSTDSL